MTRHPVLIAQAGLSLLALLAVGTIRICCVDWALYGTCVPGVVAVVAPLLCAWDRRRAWTTAIGAPVATVAFVAAAWLAVVVASFARSRACDQGPTACEGYGIFLAVYPIHAALLLALALGLGGLARLASRLATTRRGPADRTPRARGPVA